MSLSVVLTLFLTAVLCDPYPTPKVLHYFGGETHKHVEVIPIYWNDNVPYLAEYNSLYSYSVKSTWQNVLKQYGIEKGHVKKIFVDDQPDNYDITDAQIQEYLIDLISKGAVPKPNKNTYYPIHFPADINVIFEGAAVCSELCAYHSSFTYLGKLISYSAIPYCPLCGGQPSAEIAQLSTASYELANAITNPGYRSAFVPGPPLAWYNIYYDGEIADLCLGPGLYCPVEYHGETLYLQQIWSNKKKACVCEEQFHHKEKSSWRFHDDKDYEHGHEFEHEHGHEFEHEHGHEFEHEHDDKDYERSEHEHEHEHDDKDYERFEHEHDDKDYERFEFEYEHDDKDYERFEHEHEHDDKDYERFEHEHEHEHEFEHKVDDKDYDYHHSKY